MRILLFGLFIALTSTAHAEKDAPTPWYRVEVIIFTQPDQGFAAEEEQWSKEYQPIDAENLVWLSEKPVAQSNDFNDQSQQADTKQAVTNNNDQTTGNALASQPYQAAEIEFFKTALEKLEKSTDIIFKHAWLQPGWNRENQQLAYAQSASQIYQYLPETYAEDGTVSLPEWTLVPDWFGTLAIARERYLHAQINFTLLGTSGDGLGENYQWQLQENRRMRSNEPHYLDHPKFGVLVVAVPVEFDQPLSVEESANKTSTQR